MQNTLKTQDIQCDVSKKLGNLPFCVQIIINLTPLWGKTPKKLGFSTNHKQIFTKYLQFYMRFYKGIKVNISATTHTKKIVVALIYKINPVQITTITTENTKNLLNSVPHTIENIPFKRKIVRNSYLL